MPYNRVLPHGGVHDLLERYAPDRLRCISDPFLVTHKGHNYIATYSPAIYSGKGTWIIWEPEVLTLHGDGLVLVEEPVHTLKCILCGFTITTKGLPLGWQSRGGKWYCPSCIDGSKE